MWLKVVKKFVFHVCVVAEQSYMEIFFFLLTFHISVNKLEVNDMCTTFKFSNKTRICLWFLLIWTSLFVLCVYVVEAGTSWYGVMEIQQHIPYYSNIHMIFFCTNFDVGKMPDLSLRRFMCHRKANRECESKCYRYRRVLDHAYRYCIVSIGLNCL